MIISLVVLTNNSRIFSDVTRQKAGLIPRDVQKFNYFTDKNAVFNVTAFFCGAKFKLVELDEFLIDVKSRSNGLIIIYQDALEAIASRYHTVFFNLSFRCISSKASTQNILAAVFSRCLRDFANYSRRFDDYKNQKIILLPLRNFMADDLTQLRELFRNERVRIDFATQLDRLLGSLRDRRSPKRPQTGTKEYILDDKRHFFEHGHERHALPEDKAPPHNALCLLGHDYRFGRMFDIHRHYNVTVEPQDSLLTDNFLDCHDEVVEVRRKSHVNIFTNDFCEVPPK